MNVGTTINSVSTISTRGSISLLILINLINFNFLERDDAEDDKENEIG